MTAAQIATFLLVVTATSCSSERAEGTPPLPGAQDPQPADDAGTPGTRLDLIPPVAEYTVPDIDPPAIRPVIDITQAGVIEHEGKTHFVPSHDNQDFRAIAELLEELKARPGVSLSDATIGGRTIALVDDPILVRADKWTEWHYVGKVMESCAQPDAAFWKIELGTMESGTVRGSSPGKLPAYLPFDADLGAKTLKIQILCQEWGTEVPREMKAATPFELEGHRLSWMIGPKRLETREELEQELAGIYNDVSRRVPDDATGGTRVMPVVIEPKPGVTYGDVITTVDCVCAAGFEEIHFGGGLGTRKKR